VKPYRSNRHLDFVRTLKCSVPRCRRRGEAAHIGPHGLSQRAPDDKAAPVCDPHHRELGKIGRMKFDLKYGICLMEIADRIALRPFIQVDGDLFIGRVEGHEYELGPLRIGVKSAVHNMVEFRKEALREAS
jgi:hypothetical protein